MRRPNHAAIDDFEPWPERLDLLRRLAVDAARRLDVQIDVDDETYALGYQGGSIGYRTVSGEWLHVRVTPLEGDDYRAIRERIRLADRVVPPTVPRPRELASEIFAEGDDSVFASLASLAPGWSCSRYPCLVEDDPLITADYVRGLRDQLEVLARIQQAPPHAQTLHARFGTWVREECRIYTPLSPDRLVTGHGDFHWGNFRLPDHCLVDWEYWGRVPEGYDAAQLLVMSLAVPRVRDLVAEVFAADLASNDGRRSLQLWCHVVLLSRKYEGSFAVLVDPAIDYLRDELGVEPSPRELGAPPWADS